MNTGSDGYGKEWSEKRLPELMDRLLATYGEEKGLNKVDCNNLPQIARLYEILDQLFEILFPGFRGQHSITRSNLTYHIGSLIDQIYTNLSEEVDRAIRYDCRIKQCDACHSGHDATSAVTELLESLPGIREILMTDVQAAIDGDPAARSFDDVILSYPSIDAISTYRLAHVLYKMGIPLIPRIWSERAHSRTGVDINPGATIGHSFFIDHGTGVVVGETVQIGNHVSIYQGVTLGALAPAHGQRLAGKKRHPTIEDNVIIYAGATILGGKTVIGEGSIIGGNVWLTGSVPPRTRVHVADRDLLFSENVPGLRRNGGDVMMEGEGEKKEKTPVKRIRHRLAQGE